MFVLSLSQRLLYQQPFILDFLVNLEALESILKGTSLFEVLIMIILEFVVCFRKRKISKTDLKSILPLTEALLTCAEGWAQKIVALEKKFT